MKMTKGQIRKNAVKEFTEEEKKKMWDIAYEECKRDLEKYSREELENICINFMLKEIVSK